jgi:hypothetical protein
MSATRSLGSRRNLGLITLLVAIPPIVAGDVSDWALLDRVSDLKKLARVTKNRVAIAPAAAVQCAAIVPLDHSALIAKKGAAIHVYVSPEGADAMKTNGVVFPVGTLILKVKFPAATAKSPELYTGMLKREQGFNPGCGDWEFFTLDGARRAITARGTIQSCIKCHKYYSTSDFVTKAYQ